MALQCEVHTAVLGTGEPSSCYMFSEMIDSPGFYQGVNHENREVSFEVVHTVEVDLEEEAPELAEQGVVCFFVAGMLTGEAGKLPVAGAVMDGAGLSLDTGPLFILAGVLTDAELDIFAHATRIAAGPRVVDTQTGASKPLAAVGSVNALWAYPKDLATLYCECGLGVTDDQSVDAACVDRAYRTYYVDMQQASKDLGNCMAGAAVRFWLCTAGGCGAVLLFGPVSPLAMGICAGVCLLDFANEVRECMTEYTNATDAAADRLRIALEACGVSIAYQ